MSESLDRERYLTLVAEVKRRIFEGDVYQLQLGIRFGAAARRAAPSISTARCGARIRRRTCSSSTRRSASCSARSPEFLVRLEGRKARIRPLAGTRWRGRDDEEDARIAAELLANEKERAEHVMLVDLGRNDLGSVCEYGSVHVDELLQIERYSHVMHIVSNVVGRLARGSRRARSLSCRLSGGHRYRNAEDARDAAHRRPRAGHARLLRRQHRPLVVRRRLRLVHHVAQRPRPGRPRVVAGLGRHRRRLRSRCRIRRSLPQNAHRACSARHRVMRRILFVDNFDSFSYNVVHLLASAGAAPDVLLNDDPATATRRCSMLTMRSWSGPVRAGPNMRPQMLAVLRAAHRRERCRCLGVCLGLQAIGEVFGATVTHAPRQMHGKTSHIDHDGNGVFAGLPTPISATRYHSLCLDPATIPARAARQRAQRRRRRAGSRAPRSLPVHGVQFHPESVLSEHGKALVENFLFVSS